MPATARSCFLLGLLALGAACKAAAPPDAPSDAYYDSYAEAMRDPAMAGLGDETSAAPMAGPGGETSAAPMMPAPSTAASPGAPVPTAVMGSLSPAIAATGGASSGGEKAIADDDLPTTGDDSVEQMLVFNGFLTLAMAPDTIPAGIDAAVQLAVDAGGYIAQQSDTSLTLRVPSRRFRRLMKGLEGLGQVRSRSVHTLDVSEEFHDLKVRLENLQNTRARIQKLLGQAKDLGEILVVEKELERVSAEIDAIEGRLRFLSSQAAFSTVTMAFQELPREVTIVAPDDPPPPPPPPLPSPPQRLDASADWVEEVDVHHLLRLP